MRLTDLVQDMHVLQVVHGVQLMLLHVPILLAILFHKVLLHPKVGAVSWRGAVLSAR